MNNPLHHVTMLLVEDDPGHARLIEKNLRRANITNQIIVADDGQKAVDFLFSQGEYAGESLPAQLLVLLDLNLPVLDGYEVLQRMKNDTRTKSIPVIILTTTDDPQEISHCYELGCNVYVTKPVNYDKFSEAVMNLGLFLSVVKFPNGD
jgi:CheY-like chemotaxis protein